MTSLQPHQKRFVEALAVNKALFFAPNLWLKDGRSTPYFANLGKFAQMASGMREMGDAFAGMVHQVAPEVGGVNLLFGPSYKGSAIAQAAAARLLTVYDRDLGFCYDRVVEKTHGEASAQGTLLVGAKPFPGARVFIVDDVATSMQTKVDSIDLLAEEGRKMDIEFPIVGIGVGLDREQVGPVYMEGKDHLPNKLRVLADERGEDAIAKFTKSTGIPVFSVVGVTDAVNHLFASQTPVLIDGTMQPISGQVKEVFDRYMDVYGVKR
tara:strand:- start:238 stop:1035 length:798 start_codon:yes stop_codon:yes gene_type:complete